VGVEINANHLRSVEKGQQVEGTAHPIRRGRKIHVWETTIYTSDHKKVCVSRCTLAIINSRYPCYFTIYHVFTISSNTKIPHQFAFGNRENSFFKRKG